MIEINKIICGDCLEIMKEIDDKAIDMILCDLPYGITACSWDTIIPFDPLWEQYERIVKNNGAIVLFGSQPFTSKLIMSNIEIFKYCWVWDKYRSCSSMLAKKRPLKYHEDICVFYKKQPTYNPQMLKGKMQNKGSGGKSDNYGNIPIIRYNSDTYYPRSIQRFEACHNMIGKEHPTEKPVSLMEYLIKTYTNEGDLVLDNCLGSGTTAIACDKLGRDWIGIEIEPKYCKIANERIKGTTFELFRKARTGRNPIE